MAAHHRLDLPTFGREAAGQGDASSGSAVDVAGPVPTAFSAVSHSPSGTAPPLASPLPIPFTHFMEPIQTGAQKLDMPASVSPALSATTPASIRNCAGDGCAPCRAAIVVAALYIFPVASCVGTAVPIARLQRCAALFGDRAFVLVEARSLLLLSLTDTPQLAHVRVEHDTGAQELHLKLSERHPEFPRCRSFSCQIG